MVPNNMHSMKRHRDLVYSWSDVNPTSNIPTPRSNIEHPNVQTSIDYFLEDGSYLRVRNIIVGYSLSEDVVERIGIDKLRFYECPKSNHIYKLYRI